MQRHARQQTQGRQERAALLEAIAAKRSSKNMSIASETRQAEKAEFSKSIFSELEDSSDEDEAASSTRFSPKDEEKYRIAAQPTFKRLQKKATDHEVDSIADSLRSLNVEAGSRASISAPETPPGVSKPLHTPGSAHQQPSSQTAHAGEGLCLGDSSEFKLDPAVSRKLYAHQVGWPLSKVFTASILIEQIVSNAGLCHQFTSVHIESTNRGCLCYRWRESSGYGPCIAWAEAAF